MAYITAQIPLDVSPGAFQPIRFYSLPIFQWKKVEVSVLVERILGAPEGTEGLDEVREIAARKSKEAIIVLMSTKNTISQREKILTIKKHIEFILLCRHFIFPATFFRIKDFIEKDIDPQDVEPLDDILQQQKQLQEIILQHGHLSLLQKRGDIDGSIQAFLVAFQNLPKTQQLTSLVEALQNPQKNQDTWKQIRFFYKALKNKQR